MNIKITDILAALDYQEYIGDTQAIVSKLIVLDGENQELNVLSWCSDSNIDSLGRDLKGTIICSAAILTRERSRSCNYIVVSNPRLAFTKVINTFFHYPEISEISKTALIDENVVMGAGACIGNNVTIESNCVIGKNVSIGHNSILKSNSVVGDDVVIGSSCTIGGCGFGYQVDSNGRKLRINHIGGVRLGDRVEIGNNVCIDRGVIGDTILEEGVLVDNIAHISHNVVVGKDAMIFALTVICGSSTIGERSKIAPGASVINKVSIGDDVQVGMGAVVTKNIGSHCVVIGNPARKIG